MYLLSAENQQSLKLPQCSGIWHIYFCHKILVWVQKVFLRAEGILAVHEHLCLDRILPSKIWQYKCVESSEILAVTSVWGDDSPQNVLP